MSTPSQLLDGTLCLDFINTPGDLIPFLGEAPVSGQMVASARRLRASLRRIFEGEVRGTGAPERDLSLLNRILTKAGGSRGLRTTVRGFGWGWLSETGGVERALWPVAFSAARLLAGPDLVRLKACDNCHRLFLDASRNRSRRWCDMQGCGNRAKVSRHRARVRSKRDASSPLTTPPRSRG